METFAIPSLFETEQGTVRGVNIGREELVKLYEKVLEKSIEAAEIHIANWDHALNRPGADPSDIENQIRNLYSQIHIKIELYETNSIHSNDPAILDESRFPSNPLAVKFDSGHAYRSSENGIEPRNQIQVLVDYSTHRIFDMRILPGFETPNNSNFVVSGSDQTWIYGTSKLIEKFFADHKNRRKWIHGAGIYDALIFSIFLPLGLWLLYRSNEFINKFLDVDQLGFNLAVFIYIFLLYIIFIRLFFHYIRWVFPLNSVGRKSEPSALHRFVIGGVCIAIIYDFAVKLFQISGLAF